MPAADGVRRMHSLRSRFVAKRTYGATLATVAVVVAGTAAAVMPAAAGSSSASCAAGYAYAGVAGKQPVHGLAATISATTRPSLATGHVAGWVGFAGTSAWIQAGLSSVAGQRPSLYTEVTLPGGKPEYAAIAVVRTNVRYRISVVMETGERWVALVDGRRVAGPVHLPGSAAWRPVATAESWLPGASACNAFSYRFQNVATEAGSRWTPLTDVDVLRRGGPYTVVRTGASFLALLG